MKIWLAALAQAVVLLFAVLAIGGMAMKFPGMGLGERVASVAATGIIGALAFLILRKRWTTPGKALRPILLAAGIAGICEFLYERADERTKRPDEELRNEILGSWRASVRIDAEDRGKSLPAGGDFVLASTLEVTFEPGAVTTKGEHIVSVVSPSLGSLEGRFESRERDLWSIQDRRITFTPDPVNTLWVPRADHEPTRKFREKFPNWPDTKDPTPTTMDVADLTRSKMVLIHKDFKDKTKTIRNEFNYHRVGP